MRLKSVWNVAFSLTFAAAGYFGARYFCYKQTDGFTIWGITPHRSFENSFETRPLTDAEQIEISAALNQPYFHGARGGQTYVFFSKDGKYALKLLKQRMYTIPLWFNITPLPFVLDRYKQKKRALIRDKCRRDFTSYKIAFEELQDLTGVVYIHLHPTDTLKMNLHISDKLGITHQIDLDKIDFVLQRKAEPPLSRIQRLMETRDLEGAKRSISSLVTLIVERCKRGISDKDSSIDTNCGFLGNDAIKIDVGRLGRDINVATSDRCKEELVKILTPFKEWLAFRYPDLAKNLESEIAEALDSFTCKKHQEHKSSFEEEIHAL